MVGKININDFVNDCETWQDVGRKAKNANLTVYMYEWNSRRGDEFKVVEAKKDYWVVEILPDLEGLTIKPSQVLMPTGSSLVYSFEDFSSSEN